MSDNRICHGVAPVLERLANRCYWRFWYAGFELLYFLLWKLHECSPCRNNIGSRQGILYIYKTMYVATTHEHNMKMAGFFDSKLPGFWCLGWPKPRSHLLLLPSSLLHQRLRLATRESFIWMRRFFKRDPIKFEAM